MCARAASTSVRRADAPVVLDTTGTGRPTASIPWWNPSWGQRRCVTVTNNEATTLTEYQIVLDYSSPVTSSPITSSREKPNSVAMMSSRSNAILRADLSIVLGR